MTSRFNLQIINSCNLAGYASLGLTVNADVITALTAEVLERDERSIYVKRLQASHMLGKFYKITRNNAWESKTS